MCGHQEQVGTNVNPGNFRALVEFRVEAGDAILADHFKTAPQNAQYISLSGCACILKGGYCGHRGIGNMLAEACKKYRFDLYLACVTVNLQWHVYLYSVQI